MGGHNHGRPDVLYRQWKAEPSVPKSVGNTGVYAEREAEIDAEQGSKALANHCLRAIDGFATRYGIQPDEARHLLLNTGVRL